MTWTPEREGNWLFHCHIMHHVSPERRLSASAAAGRAITTPTSRPDASAGMAGMMLGVTVVGPAATPPSSAPSDVGAPRKLTLVMARDPAGSASLIRLRAERRRRPAGADVGPRLVARPGARAAPQRAGRDHASSISSARAPRSTGTAWSSRATTTACTAGAAVGPAPRADDRAGGSFVVRFTPPRTGTFIYHTHLHDERQLPSGLYGPMIVVDAGRDVRSGDRSRAGDRRAAASTRPRRTCSIPATPVVLNGERGAAVRLEGGRSVIACG